MKRVCVNFFISFIIAACGFSNIRNNAGIQNNEAETQLVERSVSEAAEEKLASKGAITEARFIIENKLQFVNDHIQRLKKNLTQNCLFETKFKKRKMRRKDMKIKQHHCTLQCTFLPLSISEFEHLASLLQDFLTQTNEEMSLTSADLEKKVNFAFALKEKAEAEDEFLRLLCEIDQAQLRHERLKAKKTQKALELRKTLSDKKKRFHDLKKRVTENNANIAAIASAQKSPEIDKLELFVK